jgi:thioester reductase-like protein
MLSKKESKMNFQIDVPQCELAHYGAVNIMTAVLINCIGELAGIYEIPIPDSRGKSLLVKPCPIGNVEEFCKVVNSIADVLAEPDRSFTDKIAEATINIEDPWNLSISVRLNGHGLDVELNEAAAALPEKSEIVNRFLAAIGVFFSGYDAGSIQEQVFSRAHRKMDVNTNISLIGMFLRQCQENPDKVAFTVEGREYRYDQILKIVQQLAQELSESISPGDRVGVFLPRSELTIFAILCCLYLRVVYVPLDMNYPADYIENIARRVNPKIIVTLERLSPKIEPVPGARYFVDLGGVLRRRKSLSESQILSPCPPDREDAPFAILFTSGSTGQAKAVLHGQESYRQRFLWQWPLLKLESDEVFCQRTTVNFTPHIWEFLAGVLSGHKTAIFDDAIVESSKALVDNLEMCQVTRLGVVPSILKNIISEIELRKSECLTSLRSISVAGEAVTTDLIERTRKILPGVRVFNDFGSTETNCLFFSDLTELKEAQNVVLGIPNWAAEIAIKNSEGKPCKPYEPGFLFVSGKTLAHGYLDDEGHLRRFNQSDALSSSAQTNLSYCTNDRAYYNFEGKIFPLGRLDNQIKIRGMRVNLDSLLEQYKSATSISDMVLMPQEFQNKNSRLIVFVKRASGDVPDNIFKEEIFDLLRDRVPRYYLPSYIRVVDDIPVLISGKVDRVGLKASLVDNADSQNSGTLYSRAVDAIRTFVQLPLTEQELISLSLDELGVDSLSIMECIQFLNSRFGIELPVNEVVKNWSFIGIYYILRRELSIHENVNIKESMGVTPEQDLQKLKEYIDNLPTPAIAEKPLSEETIVVTGATGHLGIHLTHHLLKNTSYDIAIIVRESLQAPLDRIRQKFKQYHLHLNETDFQRLKVHAGDIERPNFGLTDKIYQSLCSSCFLIYHLAADVNHLSNYASLRRPLVKSWRNLTEFSTKNHLKELIFTSSISVNQQCGDDIYRHEDYLEQSNAIASGYGKTKWLGEQVLGYLSNKLGMKTAAIRFGEIGGNITNSKAPLTQDLVHGFLNVLRYSPPLTVETVDKLQNMVVDILPVDWVADFLCQSCQSVHELPRIVHATHPSPVSLVECLRELQCPESSDVMDYQDWLDCLSGISRSKLANFLNGLELFFIQGEVEQDWMAYFKAINLDNAKFKSLIESFGMSAPPDIKSLLSHYRNLWV